MTTLAGRLLKPTVSVLRATCYRPSDGEEVAESTETVDLKVFNTEGVRDSELVGGEPRYAKVADGVWAFDVLRDAYTFPD